MLTNLPTPLFRPKLSTPAARRLCALHARGLLVPALPPPQAHAEVSVLVCHSADMSLADEDSRQMWRNMITAIGLSPEKVCFCSLNLRLPAQSLGLRLAAFMRQIGPIAVVGLGSNIWKHLEQNIQPQNNLMKISLFHPREIMLKPERKRQTWQQLLALQKHLS